MSMTQQQQQMLHDLQSLFPQAKQADLMPLVQNSDVLAKAGINTPERQRAFFAQTGHETQQFMHKKETGNSSPYAGGGYIQLTGQGNYAHTGKRIGQDLGHNPQLLNDPRIALQASTDWWNEHKLNNYADKGDNNSISKIINQGNVNAPGNPNGFAERNKYYQQANQQGLFSGGLGAAPTPSQGITRPMSGSPTPGKFDVQPIPHNVAAQNTAPTGQGTDYFPELSKKIGEINSNMGISSGSPSINKAVNTATNLNPMQPTQDNSQVQLASNKLPQNISQPTAQPQPMTQMANNQPTFHDQAQSKISEMQQMGQLSPQEADHYRSQLRDVNQTQLGQGEDMLNKRNMGVPIRQVDSEMPSVIGYNPGIFSRSFV